MALPRLCCFACLFLCAVTGQARDVYTDEHVTVSYVVPQELLAGVIYEDTRRPNQHVRKGDGRLRMVWSQYKHFQTHLLVLLLPDDNDLWRGDHSSEYIAHKLTDKLQRVGREAAVSARDLAGKRWWRVEERNGIGTVFRVYYATRVPPDSVLHCSLMLDEEKSRPVKPSADEWAKLERGLEHLVASVEINVP